MDKRIRNLVGERFGHWLVVSYAGYSKGKANYHKWLCQCDCGTQREVNGPNLKKGLSTSCGCTVKDMTGMTFGKLKVIKYIKTVNHEAWWECECACGNKKITSGHSLRRGGTKSCGCLAGQHCITHGLSKNGKEYRKYLLSSPFRRLRSRVSISVNKALKRRKSSKKGHSIWEYLPYTINELKNHLESLWEPWMNWNNYSGRSNDPRQTWHIDHIIPHSSFRYKSMDEKNFLDCWALSNLRPLEKKLNAQKGAKSSVAFPV